MNGKKKVLMALICVLLVASVAAGLMWHNEHYVMVDFEMYARDTAELDLRAELVTPEKYEKLTQAMPDCRIHWNVPFQDTSYPEDTREITITSLAEEDLDVLAYLPQLQTVHAEDCTDYLLLQQLQARYPGLRVLYSIVFSDGSAYNLGATEVTLRSVAERDVQLLHLLPELKKVTIGGGGSLDGLDAFRGTAHNLGLEFCIEIGGQEIPDTTKVVSLPGLEEEDLPLLELLPEMQTLHIQNPNTAPASLLALRQVYPRVKITWEVNFAGQTYTDTATEVDLSMVEVTDLAEIEKGMSYLPDAEKLILGLCGIDNPDWGASRSKLAQSKIENEDLSAYRDRVRDQYKVVWTVRLGPSIALRTDADNFMPNHYGVGRLFNDYAYNLRYCEDMVCLDVGHMTLTDISFVEFMPNLKYLILAWTEVQYIEPIRSCKNLVFLELDNSCIRDYSPLVDCTALEDLNIGKTFCDITPICQMTWLKNLYMIFGDGGDAWTASQALPNTRVVASGNATVGSGWRKLQNYYDMRDCLGVPYMNG